MAIISPDLSGLTDGQTADAADVKNPLITIIDEFNGSIDSNNVKINSLTGDKLVNSAVLTTPVLTSPTYKGLVDGWVDPSDTWTYASATTITVTSGAAAIYSVGDKIKLTQTTVKYFYITAVADTILTITGGTDYTLVSATITNNYYSKASSPVGFTKWFNWAPTFSCSAGTLTSVNVFRSQFKIDGNNCILNLDYNGTTSNNCTDIAASLPINTTMAADFNIEGGCSVTNGPGGDTSGFYYIYKTSQQITVRRYDQSTFTVGGVRGAHINMVSYPIG